MKDGRTHLAHKAEHAVDLTSGALLAVTLQPAIYESALSVKGFFLPVPFVVSLHKGTPRSHARSARSDNPLGFLIGAGW